MINENFFMLGGRLAGVKIVDDRADIFLRLVSMKDKKLEQMIVPVTLRGDTGKELAGDLVTGDFVGIKGSVCLDTSQKTESGHNSRLYQAVWDEYDQPIIVRGDKSSVAVVDGSQFENINIIRLGGIFKLCHQDKNNNPPTPTLRDANGRKYCYFDLGVIPKPQLDSVYFNMSMSGGSVEGAVTKWFCDGDNVLVRARFGMRTSRDKFRRKNKDGEMCWTSILTPTIWIDGFNGVSHVKPLPRQQHETQAPAHYASKGPGSKPSGVRTGGRRISNYGSDKDHNV